MLDKMSEVLRGAAVNVFGVLDGAAFPDIQRLFLARNIPAKSLFLSSTAYETISAGPWLININGNEFVAEQAAGLAHEGETGVFWFGKFSEEEIYRHLRQLNLAKMPDGEPVYFRHYDPSVFAAVAELLDAKQAAVLMGSAEMVVLGGRKSTYLGEIKRPDGLPTDIHGLLCFSQQQIDALNARQLCLYRENIKQIIRTSLPDETHSLNDSDLERLIERNDAEANQLGLTSEDALGKWSYIYFITNGASSRNERLYSFLKRSGPKDMNESMNEGFVTILYDWELSKIAKRQSF